MPRRNARNFALFAAILRPSWTSFGTPIIHTIIPHWGTNLFARICLSRDFQSRGAHLGRTRHRRYRRRRLHWVDDDDYGDGNRATDCGRQETAVIDYVTTKSAPGRTSRLAQQRMATCPGDPKWT